MDSPGRLKLLKRGTTKAKLPRVNTPPLVVKGVEPTRVIRLPRFNELGQVDGAVLIVRQGNKEKVRNAVRRVKTKVRRSKRSAA